MLKVILWVMTNLILLVFLYFGYFCGVEQAKNVFLFFAWFMIISTVLSTGESIKKEMAKIGRSVPVWVSVPVDFIVVISLAWNGSFVMATFWLLATLVAEGVWMDIDSGKYN